MSMALSHRLWKTFYEKPGVESTQTAPTTLNYILTVPPWSR